jgi:hypothetical protein
MVLQSLCLTFKELNLILFNQNLQGLLECLILDSKLYASTKLISHLPLKSLEELCLYLVHNLSIWSPSNFRLDADLGLSSLRGSGLNNFVLGDILLKDLIIELQRVLLSYIIVYSSTMWFHHVAFAWGRVVGQRVISPIDASLHCFLVL